MQTLIRTVGCPPRYQNLGPALLEYIDSHRSFLQEVMYNLYNYIEPNLEGNLNWQFNQLSGYYRTTCRQLKVKSSRLDRLEPTEVFDLTRFLGQAAHKQPQRKIGRHVTRVEQLKNLVRDYLGAISFEVCELNIVRHIYENTDADSAFHAVNGLCYVLINTLERRPSFLLHPVNLPSFNYPTLFSVANAIRNPSYVASVETIHKLEPYLATRANYVHRGQSHVSYSLSLPDYQEMLLCFAGELTSTDRRLLKMMYQNRFDQHQVHLIYSVEADSDQKIGYLHTLLDSLNRECWIRQHTKAELKQIKSQANIRERNRLALEWGRLYSELYTELFTQTANETNNSTERSEPETTYPVSVADYAQYTPRQTTTENKVEEAICPLSTLLSTDHLYTLSISTADSKIKAVRTVVRFILNNRSQCIESMGLVLYQIKYTGNLPIFAGQVSDIRFRGQPLQSKCLKLNVGQGRLLFVFRRTAGATRRVLYQPRVPQQTDLTAVFK